MFPTRPQSPSQLTRRDMLKSAGCGFGYLAFAGLCGQLFGTRSASASVGGASGRAARAFQAAAVDGYVSPLAPKMPHFAPRAKRVIFLFMQGGPSHVDTFDHKPALARADGKAPGDIPGGGRGNRKLMKSPWKFSPAGKSGLMMSELSPSLATQA